jgi:hypothetical protein
MADNDQKEVPDPYEKISVSASALGQLLMALSGPDHHILELKYTRSVSSLVPGMQPNPINTLVAEWNAHAKQLANQPPSTPEGSPPT